jgi:hypothetical protein
LTAQPAVKAGNPFNVRYCFTAAEIATASWGLTSAAAGKTLAICSALRAGTSQHLFGFFIFPLRLTATVTIIRITITTPIQSNVMQPPDLH